ncbi:DUF4241 domain-containing protein [Undibacterium cyanobacteriorum]|uniref:DUF4241 domain-containing protein n=1 Tax=Undibacterium cyanobacteriorum TaxID=3073561 RepID=A0ABY9RIA0_9BURK|nr:DUF4241 domain-containing protein [Undibacterium sp. 20NA77.5]WMW80897.1 DUF4241 domain-containing protein [Undibacterium sp. 20NA77.5]
MAYMLNSKLVDLAFSESTYGDGKKLVSFEVVSAGTLHVSSGAIVACDPLVQPGAQPFVCQIAKGDYEVRLAIARLAGGDERVAFAKLAFSDSPVVDWKMALVENQSVEKLGADEFFGYGVDAGTGCFMDADAALLLQERMDQDEEYFEQIGEQMDATYKYTRSWASVLPSTASKANIVCFSSGWGDGCYPSFFGYSSDGKVVSLVTDFCVLDEAEAETSVEKKPWWQFWKSV